MRGVALQDPNEFDACAAVRISHRTINKHLENLFEKLGVETRTAAAAVAMRRLQLPAQAETKKP